MVGLARPTAELERADVAAEKVTFDEWCANFSDQSIVAAHYRDVGQAAEVTDCAME
jgi:hypothetical protein